VPYRIASIGDSRAALMAGDACTSILNPV